ncbi:MAG: hypothetical protein A3E88_00675 [Legionellales bacterium RIFCSPHIGHO2_12_FULL_35_11]|nr:MAG: hypothetical protein A3E88_00675 [Legionellales bacterium RIFCSPHIGHO2_12_FULL_35_11]
MIEKIVSGGQTGVDQAALNMAVECGIPVGGWCPLGGLDENGQNVLEMHASLVEATTPVPAERTKLNVRDSDGTLIIVPCFPLPETIKDGTQLTIDEAVRLGRPNLIISLAEKEAAAETILHWCEENNIHTLNIGGPRQSSCPDINIYEESCELFRGLFAALKSKQQFSIN